MDQLARDKAQFEQEKAEHTAAFEKHIASIQSDLDDWKRATIQKHMQDSVAASAARSEAEKLVSDAKAAMAAAASQMAEAEALMQKAQSAHQGRSGGRTVTVPGVNFDVKPYVDDGSPLPDVGARVRGLTDRAAFEGIVADTNPADRTVRVQGFVAQVQPGSEAIQSTWVYDTVDDWFAWKDLEATTSVSSNYWFSRAGS
jgi:hypothetical protein